jgi:pheromone shutdown-related protein TraB
METIPTITSRADYPQEVRIVTCGDREFVLVGTAHVSRESADLVRQVIELEKPDCVCVELDAQRFKALSQKNRWESLDLKQVIRQKQLTTLLINLLLGSYQKKIGGKLGVAPGTELLEATRCAEELGLPVELCDRHIRVTMLRAWRSMSFIQKMKLLTGVLAGIFDDGEISEEDLRELRKQDVLSELMNELSVAMPSLKRVLIDERDVFLAEKIRRSEGNRLVAIVGAGHMDGILAQFDKWENEPADGATTIDLEEISTIPPISPIWKFVGWGIPAIIIGSIGVIAWTQGGAAAGENAMFWTLANGIPSAIGALIALAHPVTILTAFIAAPITSLTPVIGAGYVTAFVQVMLQPPLVKDFQTLAEDVSHARMWWRNRLLKVFLTFMLPGFGSLIGTWIGGYEIITNLFS